MLSSVSCLLDPLDVAHPTEPERRYSAATATPAPSVKPQNPSTVDPIPVVLINLAQRRTVRPWESCGVYEKCKKMLINYLERILQMKHLLGIQSKLIADNAVHVDEKLPLSDWPPCRNKIDCMIRLYRSG